MSNKPKADYALAKTDRLALEKAIQPARQRSLGDDVYEALAKLINSGELEAGQKLPSEGNLCRLFAVSRPIVRKALSRCRDNGLIISHKGSGSFVSSNTLATSTEIPPEQQLSKMLHALEFRRSTEPEAAYYAAIRRSPEELKNIAKALEDFRYFEDGESRPNVDIAFHRAIARASQNDHYVRSLELIDYDIDLGITLARHLSRLGQVDRRAAIYTEHHQIYLAIETQDPEAAHLAMRKHLEYSQLRVIARGEEMIRRIRSQT
nr:FadR/GntR family transcriptional regulator [uncultured Halomonas sp.]